MKLLDTFADNKQKIFDFMNQVEQKKQAEAEDQAFKNSTNYKLKCLDKEQNVAKDKYLHGVFANVYAKSLPYIQFADTFAKLLILFEITKYLSKKTY